jgi:hypothetical protein
MLRKLIHTLLRALNDSCENFLWATQGDPGGARRSQEEPGGARRTEEEPRGARRSQGDPGGARRSQEEPRRSQEEPGGPKGRRSNQEEPGGSTRTQDYPGGSSPGGLRRSQEDLGGARRTEEETGGLGDPRGSQELLVAPGFPGFPNCIGEPGGTSLGMRPLLRPMVLDRRMFSVTPAQSKSSRFMTSASWAMPFQTLKSPVFFQYMYAKDDLVPRMTQSCSQQYTQMPKRPQKVHRSLRLHIALD